MCFKLVTDSGEEMYARPTFIRQSPYVIAFVKLELINVHSLRAQVDGDPVAQLRSWSNVFKVDLTSWAFSDQGDFNNALAASVLTDSCMRAGWVRCQRVRVEGH